MKKCFIWALLLLGCVICWYHILNFRYLFSGMDFLCLILPQTLFSYDMLLSGEFGLWCPFEYCGVPLFAAMQSAQAFPGTWVFYVLHFALNSFQSNNIYAFQIMTIVHIMLGAIGATLFYKSYFHSCTSEGIIAGIIFAGNSFLLGHIEQLNSIAAISLIPWYFYAMTVVVSSTQKTICRSSILLFGLLVACGITCGHPHYLALSFLFGFPFVVLYCISQKFTIWQHGRAIALCCGVMFLGIVLAAVQVLPTHELSKLSERVFPYPDPDAPAYRWSYIQSFFSPFFYQHLAGVKGIPIEFTEIYNYSSIAGILLAIWGLICLIRQRSLQGYVLIILFTLTLLYSFGREGGISWIPQELFSYFRNSRGSARALSISVLFLAVMSAYGMRHILLHFPHQRGLLLLSATFGLIVLDYTWAHHEELSQRMVDSRANPIINSTYGMIPLQNIDSRTYRFAKDDSDYYLDYSATAMEIKYKRLQPNLNYHYGVATIDGYEEGLLPTLPVANFMRQYNRNLRNAEPDAKLLAVLGVKQMLTDFPFFNIKNGNEWTLASSSASDGLSIYNNVFRKDSGLVYDARILGVNRQSSVPEEREYIARNSALSQHMFLTMTTETLSKAGDKLNANMFGNHVFISDLHDISTDCLLLPIPNYPGWKSKNGNLTTLNALMSVFKRNEGCQSGQIVLLYMPFSFRLGLFISLVSFVLVTIVFLSCLLRKTVKLE